MKKGWKIFWAVCASAAGVGIILCIIGVGMGGSLTEINRVYKSGRFFSTEYNSEEMEHLAASEDGGGQSGKNPEDITQYRDIHELEAELTYLTVILEEYEGDSVEVDASDISSKLQDRLICKQEDGKLEINYTDKGLWKQIGKNNAGRLLIKVPAGTQFEEVSMGIGAGELSADNILANNLKISVGTGTADITSFESEELEVECGTGILTLKGEARSTADIDCGIGEVNWDVVGSEENYNYKVNCGIGAVSVGNRDYSGFSGESYVDNSAAGEMDIKCGIGTININFGEE